MAKVTTSPIPDTFGSRLAMQYGVYGPNNPLRYYAGDPLSGPTYDSFQANNIPTDQAGTTDVAPPPDTSGTDTSGGSGGTISVAPPTQDLATAPEWLAFLNQLGLEKDQFTSDINRQRGVAQNLAAQQAADITAQGPGQRRQITGGLEARGMARSGQLIRNLADQRAAEGRAQGQVQAGLTGTLSGLESQLAQKLLDLNQQQAQQELQLRASGAYT